MKAPEPTPENLEKAREQTDSGLCDSMLEVEREALTRNIAFMLDEAVREERERCADIADFCAAEHPGKHGNCIASEIRGEV